MSNFENVWIFQTARYVIALAVAPDDDPAQFIARVTVSKNNHVIGSDYLHGCDYRDVSDFYTSHRDRDPMNRNCTMYRAKHGENHVVCHYFPDMVRVAIADAMDTMRPGDYFTSDADRVRA